MVRIRLASEPDAEAVAAIYSPYVDRTAVPFDAVCTAFLHHMLGRIPDPEPQRLPRLRILVNAESRVLGHQRPQTSS